MLPRRRQSNADSVCPHNKCRAKLSYISRRGMMSEKKAGMEGGGGGEWREKPTFHLPPPFSRPAIQNSFVGAAPSCGSGRGVRASPKKKGGGCGGNDDGRRHKMCRFPHLPSTPPSPSHPFPPHPFFFQRWYDTTSVPHQRFAETPSTHLPTSSSHTLFQHQYDDVVDRTSVPHRHVVQTSSTHLPTPTRLFATSERRCRRSDVGAAPTCRKYVIDAFGRGVGGS